MFDLAAAYRRLHWSRDQLAKRVLSRWAPAEGISHRNLSNQIAHLEKGNKVWWLKRLDAAKALADELGIELEDLGLEREVVPGGTMLPFRDFPAVSAFDPRADTPCELGNTRWFQFPPEVEAPAAVWIHAPAGTGWTLFGEIYRQRYGVPVQTVGTLSAVIDKNPADWLVVQVRAPDEETELEVEKRLAARGKTIVCARFRPWAPRHGFTATGAGAFHWGIVEPEPTPPPPGLPSWHFMEGDPPAGWREQFIRWLADRVRGGPAFNIKMLVRWLNERDPHAVLFTTPADVIALAGFAHEVGTKSWTEAAYEKLPLRWMAARISADPADAVQSWLASAARDSVIHALHRWVESTAPWLQAQQRSIWFQWLPAAPGVTKALDLDRRLAELEATRDRAKRAEKKAALMAAVAQMDAEGLFRKLEAERVLVPGRLPGDWQFQPNWLAAWLGGQHVDALVRKPDVASWGRIAILRDRQDLVDQALDRLEHQQFEETLERAVASFTPSSLPAIAAVESLFLAVGRRLGKGERFEAIALLALWKQVSQSLQQRYLQVAPVLVTRYGPGDLDRRGHEWVEACWEWSRAVPRPQELPAESDWLFPGWFELSFDTCPNWLGAISSNGTNRLVALAEELLSPHTPGALRIHVPRWIRAPVLVARLKRGVAMTDADVEHLEQDRVVIAYVAQRAPELSPEARASLALLLWRHCSVKGRVNPYMDRGPLHDFIDANLTEADFSEWMKTGYLERAVLKKLPVAHQKAAVRYWLDHDPQEIFQLVHEPRGLSGEVIELMVGRYERPYEVMRLLWSRAPLRALHYAEQALRDGHEETANWFFEGSSYLPVPLLSLLEQVPEPPPWAARWLSRLLLAHPAIAERIYALRLRVRAA